MAEGERKHLLPPPTNVPPVELRTGAVVDSQVAVAVMFALSEIKNTGLPGLQALADLLRFVHEGQELAQESKRILRLVELLDEQYNLSDAVKSVIMAAVTITDDSFNIHSPYPDASK